MITDAKPRAESSLLGYAEARRRKTKSSLLGLCHGEDWRNSERRGYVCSDYPESWRKETKVKTHYKECHEHVHGRADIWGEVILLIHLHKPHSCTVWGCGRCIQSVFLKRLCKDTTFFPFLSDCNYHFLSLLSGKTLRWETIGLLDIRCCNRIIHGQEHIQELSLEEAVSKSPLLYNSQFCYPV